MNNHLNTIDEQLECCAVYFVLDLVCFRLLNINFKVSCNMKIEWLIVLEAQTVLECGKQ